MKMEQQLEHYINFWTEFEPDYQIKDEDLCILCQKGQVLLQAQKEGVFPCYEQCKTLIQYPEKLWYLGRWKGKACFAYALTEEEGAKETIDQLALEWTSTMDARWEEQMELCYLAIKALHLLTWDRSSQYCGYCGSLNERKEDERAKKCPKCKAVFYPKISPAIIVGIKKGHQILMAHNANFKEGLYSIIAGFVEQGETVEMAVRREVYEEVGIKIKNIKYHHSRPWGAMDSLMLGFTAEYVEGEIKVDGKEITDAYWCDKDHLPPLLPAKITTARTIIDEILGLED